MSRKQLFSRFSVHLILLIAVLWVSQVFGQYILNTETGKVHLPTCRTVQAGNQVGRNTVQGGSHFVEVASIEGHDTCLVCHPGGRPVQVPVAQPTVRQEIQTVVTPAPVARSATPTPAARQEVPTRGSWTPGPTAAPTPVPATVNRITPQPVEKPPLQWGWQKVQRLVDGDTFVLENGWTVRLIGADTPETVHPNRPAQPFGKEATEYTKAFMTLGKNWVYLEEDGDKTDRYDRQLAMVYIEIPPYGRPDDSKIYFLNDLLIWEGLAKAQTQYNYSQKMKDKFTQSEKEAREHKAGIWSQAL